jgi:NAD(P)-dependent dehydrogenase (short-subunit alcohol dehydrogenase family)
MSQLSNKRILVTGASRGVGEQIALALAEHNCQLFVHSRSLENSSDLVTRLRKKGARVEAIEAQLESSNDVAALIRTIREKAGGLDVLYNNAAIMSPWCEAHTTPAEDYRLSFEVNVIALAKLCDAFIPGMVKQGWGRIVNVTSGIENIRELLPYSISKAAVDRYVRDVAPSLEGTGVVMSLLDPGWLRTSLGGEQAPNSVETCIPGALVPLLLPDDAKSGQFFCAQDYRTDQTTP